MLCLFYVLSDLQPCGRWNSHYYSLLDVTTNVYSGGMTTHGRYYVVADGKPLAECWQMLQPKWQME